MKFALRVCSFSMLIACSATVQAQTNAFPAEGNVGIGTTHPRGALHILRSGPPPPALPREQNGLLLGSRSTTEFKWIQSYGAVLAVNPQGNNVAIGRTTATHRLDLGGAARFRPSPTTNLLVGSQGDDVVLDLIKNTTTTPSARIELNGITDPRAHDGEIAFHTKQSLVPTMMERMRIKADGRVGVGTGSPGDRLHVHGGNFRLTQGGSWPLILEQSSASVFTIQNGGGVSLVLEPDGLAAVARLRPLANGEHDFGHVCVYPRFPPGATVSQGWYFSRCGSAKEYVASIDTGSGLPDAGDLVSIVPNAANPYGDRKAPFVVAKSAKPCDDLLLGFVSDPAGGGADGHRLNENYVPLAIHGYFPVKVSVESGAIRRGDPITSSSTPGYGMKATPACRSVAYALEDADRDGIIRVFAHLDGRRGPDVEQLEARIARLEARLRELESRMR
jgi:hypothetical protein